MKKLKAQVEKIFGAVEEYREDTKTDEVRFVVEAGEINFDKLKSLSDLLETRAINLHGEGCGCSCEECNYFGEHQRIVIAAAKVGYRPLEAS